jgi:hypothetical protein
MEETGMRPIFWKCSLCVSFIAAGLWTGLAGQDDDEVSPPDHANCSLFYGKDRDANSPALAARRRYQRSALTDQVVRRLPSLLVIPGGSRTNTWQQIAAKSTIDSYIFQALDEKGVAPAPTTTDAEFLRRVSLDLTGRIPKPEKVVGFLNDTSADKREKLIDELLGTPEFIDKWTMYFGDLLENNSNTDQVRREPEGRNAFYSYIKTSLAQNKPYNRMAAELISTSGQNSFEQGEVNWLIGAVVTGGPQQDIWDSQTYKTFETFLGISHMNCLLCHDGRGHLDSLSLWGRNTRRTTAWGVASFYSHTLQQRVAADPNVNNFYYWRLADNPAQIRTDYALNTTTGNRPARCKDNVAPAPGKGCAATATVPAKYLDGEGPAPGESPRAALARKVTGDFQFARATVNYVWAQFFGRGIVDPVNQFDPARLDPDNPPNAPWPLQPSNPRLLNAMAQEFIDTGYDLKALMKRIAGSQTYQLSSRYDGQWNPAWEPLFARKLVRRLWSEEVHDAVAQASNLIPTYNVRGIGSVRWAMQLPETAALPDGAAGAVSSFLDSFLRGNRFDQDRRDDGSLLQALNMMNDPFVMNRIRSNNAGGLSGKDPSLVMANVTKDDTNLVTSFFLTVLSRYPSDEEKAAAMDKLRGTAGQQRVVAAQSLLWTLFNKVDFLFNY